MIFHSSKVINAESQLIFYFNFLLVENGILETFITEKGELWVDIPAPPPSLGEGVVNPIFFQNCIL